MLSKKYICNNVCWVASKKAMFMPGDIIDFSENEVVPGHFTCIEPEPVVEPVKEEPKFEEVKVENPEVEEIEDESPIIEPKEEPKRKPKRFGE